MEPALIIVAVVLIAHLLDRSWPRSNAARFRRAYGEWSRECDAQGMTVEQKIEEYQFRHAMVRLRRRVSDLAIHDPLHWREHLAKISVEEGKNLAAFDKKTARRFLKVIQELSPSDILYHDALGSVLAARATRPTNPSDDDIAAVTTIRSRNQVQS